MNNQPLVSIIIPTYNRAHLIGETLDSVFAQTYQYWECIIVDDGSTDNTDEVVGEYVKKDKRFKYYHRPDEHLPGGNGARNYGFKQSCGQYICWLDSDDLIIDTYLKTHTNRLKFKNSDVSVCGLNLFTKNPHQTKDWLSDNWKYCDYNSFCEGYIKFNFGLGISCFVWKRNFFNGLNLYCENLKRSQEYEFICRLLLLSKPKIVKTFEILVLYRQHHGNKNKNLKTKEIESILSGLLAKEMVINHAKESKKLTEKLKEYFIADALTYLRYDIKNINEYTTGILLQMDVKRSKNLINNYKAVSKYIGFIKIKNKDIEFLQKEVPLFLLHIKFYLIQKKKRLTKIFDSKTNTIANA